MQWEKKVAGAGRAGGKAMETGGRFGVGYGVSEKIRDFRKRFAQPRGYICTLNFDTGQA